MFYTASIINMTNCVEYNDYKQGERNEAVVSTLRPFMAKFAGALQMIIVTIVLTLSGIYGLSQSISTLEAQKNYFDLMSYNEQIVYVEKINDLVDEIEPQLSSLEVGSDAYNQKVASLTEMLESDPNYAYYAPYKIDAGYIAAIKDAKVTVTTYDANNNVILSSVELGRVGDIADLETAVLDKVGAASKYDVTLVLGGTDSAADINFKAKSTDSMRIWLRVAVAGIPIVCLFIAWLIQRKKFIIDENYYDDMIAKIEKRNAEKQ